MLLNASQSHDVSSMYSLFGDSQEYSVFGSDISDIDNVSDSDMNDSEEEYLDNIDELINDRNPPIPYPACFKTRS